MNVLAYSRAAVLADYARAAGGLVIVCPPLILVDTSLPVTLLLAAGCTVFVMYGLRTVRLHMTRIHVDGDGVNRLSPARQTIPWKDLTGLRLAYYSTRRDRTNGWMQLVLTGRDGRLAVDSRLNGFDAVTAWAATAATNNGLSLDPSTVINLQAVGVTVGTELGLEVTT